MAFSIVAQTPAAPDSLARFAKGSRCSCDIYAGSADDLIAAGLMNADQLKPQMGRPVGRTAFLPNGEACPPTLRAWREPGYKAIRQQDDGSISIEITVGKDVQLRRRKAEKAAKHEAEQERINEEVAERGHEYRNWVFRQVVGASAETWEGTKAQLQAAGLGVGQKFPGEPGAPQELRCKCPLGFDFLVRIPGYNRAMAAARIYAADSWFDLRREEPKKFITHARGVVLEVWAPDGYMTGSDIYIGSAEALLDAGLVPDARLFPGQLGTNKTQASYLKNWEPATTANAQNWGAIIRKRGKSGQFTVEIPVAKEEAERRRTISEAREEERMRNVARLSAERKQLRQAADQGEMSDDNFRAERAKAAELFLDVLWSSVFGKSGPLSFDIPKDSELWEDLAGAFQTIREAVQKADVRRDKKQQAAAQAHFKLVAARNNKSLQSLLQNAKSLRLVLPASDDGQG